MRHPWFFVIPLIALVVIVILVFLHFRKKSSNKKRRKGVSNIAHTRDVRELPEYIKAKKRYSALICIALVLFIVSITSATILVSRPISVTESKNELKNRDIMLCLDVSGSMNDYLINLLNYFEDLINNMRGERIGIVIFDGVYATLSPLTDDYLAISEVLSELRDGGFDYRVLSDSSTGMSQIGIGLAGCVTAFGDLKETERSRAIILATDNSSYKPIITTKQSAQLARNNDITVYGLFIRRQVRYGRDGKIRPSSYETSFSEAIALTGGTMYVLKENGGSDNAYIKAIVDKIM